MRSNEQASPTGTASDMMQPGGHAGIQSLSLFPETSTGSDDSLPSINRTNTPANCNALRPINDMQTSNRASSTQNIPRISNLDQERNVSRGRGSPHNRETTVYRSNNNLQHRPSLPVEETSGSTLSSDPSVVSTNSSAFQPVTPLDDIRKLRSLPLPMNVQYKAPSDLPYGQGQLPQPIQPSIVDPQPLSPYFGYPPSHIPSELRESSSPSTGRVFQCCLYFHHPVQWFPTAVLYPSLHNQSAYCQRTESLNICLS